MGQLHQVGHHGHRAGRAVAQALDQDPGDLERVQRQPRQVAEVRVARSGVVQRLPEIGELFGGRDHTTVLHAVRKIAAERQKNTDLNHQLHVLEQTLKG